MMKTLFICSILQFLLLSPALSQQAETSIKPNLKYGKPSEEELSLSTYPADTTATAIYLFHQGQTDFIYHDGFQLVTEHWIRIKILKPQGVSYADVSVPYYAPADRNADRDNASEVDGCSYNMENGKCVKTPLKRDLISYERVNNRMKLLKFSLPAVKAGTVIEYHYKLTSDYFVHIDNWMMQEEIPMIYNDYQIKIPNVFIYNIELRGKDFIKVKEKNSSMHASGKTGGTLGVNKDFTISTRELTFTSENLPAIRQDEAYCWCPEDYKIQISFDLQGTNFPGRDYEPYSQKWEDVDKQLTKPESEDFGKHLSYINPYREDTKALFSNEMSTEQKIISSFLLLKKKLAWNGKYQLFSKDLDKVIKVGNGSNADLNFVFIGILKDFGLRAYPAVLSRRSSGILPIHFPSLQKLNTFVIAIYNPDNQKYIFLDSSMDIPALNVLPLELSVDQARILNLDEKEENKWANLIDLPSNGESVNISASFDNGEIKGHRTLQLQGHRATEYQQRQAKSANNKASIEKESCLVSNVETKKTEDNFTRIDEELDFTMKADNTGDRFYINPMIFPHLEKNPFIQAERMLPVEFPYPYKFNLMCSLTVPEGYEVEELPKSQTVRTESNSLQCKYIIQKQANQILLNYLFALKASVFHPLEYKQLQEIFTQIIERNQALIVLKKK